MLLAPRLLMTAADIAHCPPALNLSFSLKWYSVQHRLARPTCQQVLKGVTAKSVTLHSELPKAWSDPAGAARNRLTYPPLGNEGALLLEVLR
jgi:hypothetical protein